MKQPIRNDNSIKKIVVIGAGVQGTVFGVRLAQKGHEVTLIARSGRAKELREAGATILDIETSETSTVFLPILESLPPECLADLCIVAVRREQIMEVLADLVRAPAIRRIVFLTNHANGSEDIFTKLGRSRTVIAFPGVAGSSEGGNVRYCLIPQQPTSVEVDAPDIAWLFRQAGFPVAEVKDMDAWLRRHAVFITAIVGVLYENSCDARKLAGNREAVRAFICAVREGWLALDRRRGPPAPFALRMILCWIPLRFSVTYWCKLLASHRGDLYFAQHARHAPVEMVSLAADVRALAKESEAPGLYRLLRSIDRWHPAV